MLLDDCDVEYGVQWRIGQMKGQLMRSVVDCIQDSLTFERQTGCLSVVRPKFASIPYYNSLV